jgi:hypothetical protein
MYPVIAPKSMLLMYKQVSSCFFDVIQSISALTTCLFLTFFIFNPLWKGPFWLEVGAHISFAHIRAVNVELSNFHLRFGKYKFLATGYCSTRFARTYCFCKLLTPLSYFYRRWRYLWVRNLLDVLCSSNVAFCFFVF